MTARVIIVDDDPDDRALEARLLQQAIPDLVIVEVAAARGWAAVLAGPPFDIVISDYHLSWSDGLKVLNEVKSRWPERPVIIVTGTGTEEVAVEAMKAGAEDYVLKSRQRIARLPTVVRGALERAVERARDRAVHERLEAEIEERARVTASLGRIGPLDQPDETARLVCAEIRSTLGLEVAALYWVLGDELLALAVDTDSLAPITAGELLPHDRGHYLLERAAAGPWIEEWGGSAPGNAYLRAWRDAGFSVGAYVPLVRGGTPAGLIVAGSGDDLSVDDISRRLSVLVEYGALARALIEPAMAARATAFAKSSDVRSVIAREAFSPVFQPIIGLAIPGVAGYEALTRFDDEVSPAVHFSSARAAGIGVELELATLGAAARASTTLPPGPFLSINVSAELVMAAVDLAPLLHALGRPIVLELTEHEARVEGPAFLARLKRLGGDVRLAIDDAGAGYAGLRRILDLRPAFVKLDIDLVRNIHRDPAREALIAGMVHFASETGASLIAEGIEREGEREVLRRLGVQLGQGYLPGRPAPAEAWATPDDAR